VLRPIAGNIYESRQLVQASGCVDGYNRYGYCLNNPLKYSDPSGEAFGSVRYDNRSRALVSLQIIYIVQFLQGNWGVKSLLAGVHGAANWFNCGAIGGLGSLFIWRRNNYWSCK